jgi:hypothetical protein
MAKNAKVSNAKSATKNSKNNSKKAATVKAATVESVSNAYANSAKLANLLKLANEKLNEQASRKNEVIFTAHEFLTVQPTPRKVNKNGGLILKWNEGRAETLANMKAVAAEYGCNILGTYQQASSCARRLYLVENCGKISAFTLHELNCLQATDGNRYDNQEQTTDYSSSSPRFAAAMAAGTVDSLDAEYKEYHDEQKAKRLQQYMKR